MYEIGRWLAEVTAAALTTAKTGTDQVLVEFRFLEGPNEGQRITEYLALTDGALPYTVKKLRACGLPNDDLARIEAMIGTEVDITLKQETRQNGKEMARVSFIDPPRAKRVSDPEVTQRVADKWRAKIAALPKEAEQPDPFA